MRLIELMVVVIISIILSSIAWLNLKPLILQARTVADRHEMELVVVAIMMVETRSGSLPSNLAGLSPVYFRVGSGFDRDSQFRPYTYNTINRTLCSVDNGCFDF